MGLLKPSFARQGAATGASIGAMAGSPLGPVGAGVGAGFGGAMDYVAGDAAERTMRTFGP
ncbi:MAG: hypothetical protein ABEJ31_00140 [Haloarculaceae archaeon]